MKTVTLQPIAMNGKRANVYVPDSSRPQKRVTTTELRKYKRVPVKVSYDGISNPVEEIAYGYGLYCWYLKR